MKINKFTSALVAMGVISLASAAQASTPVVYLTGSTAARAIIYSACTTAGQVFDASGEPAGDPKVVSLGNSGANDSSGASQIVYEGNIGGVLYDIDCSFTGSEAGIAAVAGQPLTQVTGNPPESYSLPGVPPSFLTQASSWTSTSTLPIAGGVSVPDLTMADTSQAVSLTSKVTYPLNDYGVVGIVPFTIMKGYEATTDQAWNDVVNVTSAELNQNVGGPLNANFYTGVPADSGDSVVIVGRNKGSGTRVNALLNFQYPVSQTVDQWAYDVSYPGSTPGVLTFGGAYTAGQTITDVGNDGFDSGSSVQKVLNVDGTGQGTVLLGYVGISDAANAHATQTATGAGSATYLPFNGVYESDSAVENGSYAYWGQEHLLGAISQTTAGSTVGAALKAGIIANLGANDGGASGAVGPVYSAQSILIPSKDMQVSRTADGGFPVQ